MTSVCLLRLAPPPFSLLSTLRLPPLSPVPLPRFRHRLRLLSSSSSLTSIASLPPSPPDLHLNESPETSSTESPAEASIESTVSASLPRFPIPKLSIGEKKELSSYAHSLGKKLKSQQVGKSGVTPSVAAAFVENLESNELLKLKVHGSCPGELIDVIRQLEEATGSVAVGQIGRSVILYRPSISKMKKKEAQSSRRVWNAKPKEPPVAFQWQKKGRLHRSSPKEPPVAFQWQKKGRFHRSSNTRVPSE